MRAGKAWAAAISLVGFVGFGGAARADQSLVERGAYLARAGDCQSCHTAPGNKPYSGGAPIGTPFGPIYPPNITPDKTNGIGAWTDDQFYRALHEGVGHNGENLYPAFPYPWYTKITRDDVLAVRAFLNTVPPSDLPSKPAKLIFPFNLRTGLAAWNDAFFKAGEYKPEAAKSAEWNRGAYLVQGFGHCGDCHTPKGTAMEPVTSKAFAGGAIQDWYAPDITSDAQGVGSWSVDDLLRYLKTGVASDKRLVAGLMSQVVHDSLRYLTDDDVRAIATYLKDTPAIAAYPVTTQGAAADPHGPGATAYLNHCSSCHKPDGEGVKGAIAALDGNGLVTAKGPENVIRVILGGHLALGSYAAMPAVGVGMTDEEIAEVTDYVRNAWSNHAPFIDTAGLVSKIRQETPTSVLGEGKSLVNNDPCWGGEFQPVRPIEDADITQSLGSLKAQTMLPDVAPIVAKARQAHLDFTQADVLNGLAVAFCRVQEKSGALAKPEGRQILAQFLSNTYTALTSNGRE